MNNLKCYILASCIATICCHTSIHTSLPNVAEGKNQKLSQQVRDLEADLDFSPAESTSRIELPKNPQQASLPHTAASKAVADWNDDDDDGVLVTATSFVARIEQNQSAAAGISSQQQRIATSYGDATSSFVDQSLAIRQLHDPSVFTYVIPEIPDQKEKTISTKWMTESYVTYLLRIIKAGQFDAAHSRPTPEAKELDPNINAHSGRALVEGTTELVTILEAHNKALTILLAEQHKALQAKLDPVFLITQAAQRRCAKGSIDEKSARHELMVLKEMQRRAEERTDKAHEENQAREEALKSLRMQYFHLLPNPQEEDQISPSRRKQSPQRGYQEEEEEEEMKV